MPYHRSGKPVSSLPDRFYSTEYYTDMLLEWIERDRGDEQPVFAYLAYTASHDPLHAPKKYIEKYEGVYDGAGTLCARSDCSS
jgi:arylsulfatase